MREKHEFVQEPCSTSLPQQHSLGWLRSCIYWVFMVKQAVTSCILSRLFLRVMGSCSWQQGLAGCSVNGELWHKPCRIPKLPITSHGLHSAVEEAGGDPWFISALSPLAHAVCLNPVKTRYCPKQQWKQINGH